MSREKRRRTFLRAALVATAGGLAGCSNSGGSSTDTEAEEEEGGGGGTTTAESGGGSTKTESGGGTSTPESTATETQEADTPTTVAESQVTRVQDFSTALERTRTWLEDTTNFGGSYTDLRGEEPVSVRVGTDANQGNFGYDPVAIRIEAGTTVEWQWTGNGGAHNVVGQQGTFSSGMPEAGGGITFSHTFEETGWYRYKCTSHEALGMRGAIFVDPERTLSGYPQVDSWLEGYEFSGQLDDHRNESSVEVTVGASGNSGPFAFRPIAILVSPGTTVNWSWTGRGGVHDVTWEQGDFEDSRGTGSAQGSYSQTFEEPGVYLYFCSSHRPTGGRGAVVVADG